MIELTLPNMTCGHCQAMVTKTVQKLDANAQVQVDLSTHTVRISTSTPEARVRQALAIEGYPAADPA